MPSKAPPKPNIQGRRNPSANACQSASDRTKAHSRTEAARPSMRSTTIDAPTSRVARRSAPRARVRSTSAPTDVGKNNDAKVTAK